MLDLNTLLISSVFSSNPQDITETESISYEEQGSDEHLSLDQDTFILLLSQMLVNSFEPPRGTPSAAGTLGISKEIQVEKKPEKDFGLAEPLTFEDNVAVAWISSDYYQTEINSDASFPLEVNPPLTIEKEIRLNEQQISANIPRDLLEQNKEPALDFEHNEHSKAISSAPLVSKNKTDLNVENLQLMPVKNETMPMENKLFADVTMQQSSIREPSIPIEIEDEQKGSNEHGFLTPASENLFLSKIRLSETTQDISTVSSIQSAPFFSLNENVPQALSTAHYSALVIHQGNEDSLLNTMNHSFEITADIDTPQWSKQFSEHLVWMGQQGTQRAVIKLHPEDLGPLEISIKVVNNSASVNITSHSLQARDLIDLSLPKLHEMMADQGINLTQVIVDSEGDARSFQHKTSIPEEIALNIDDDEVILDPVKDKIIADGSIDYFA